MENRYKDFILKVKEKQENKDSTIAFSLNFEYKEKGRLYMCGSGVNMFELDEEDISYLYDKYSKKMEQEMNEKIAKIKEEYNITT